MLKLRLNSRQSALVLLVAIAAQALVPLVVSAQKNASSPQPPNPQPQVEGTRIRYPEWISAGANSIAAIGVFFLAWQVGLAKQQVKDQREAAKMQRENDNWRARRELAINLILNWSQHQDRATSIAGKLVETFDSKQASDLHSYKPIKLVNPWSSTTRASNKDPDLQMKSAATFLELAQPLLKTQIDSANLPATYEISGEAVSLLRFYSNPK